MWRRSIGATDRPEAAAEATLVLSVDGKGIVMRREGLRPATAKAAAATPKLSARLSPGEKHGRKRMAEVVAGYDALPVPRTAEDILGPNRAEAPRGGARAEAKWLNASVVDNTATVIRTMFDEGERRDPDHERTWLALVDGNHDQLERIEMAAKTRQISVTILIDLIHVFG